MCCLFTLEKGKRLCHIFFLANNSSVTYNYRVTESTNCQYERNRLNMYTNHDLQHIEPIFYICLEQITTCNIYVNKE